MSNQEAGAVRPFFPREFFEQTPLACAEQLTGAVFCWREHEVRIVETEAYDAAGDPACHTWTRPSARAFVAGHPPGTAYVYLNYGVHWLFNVLIKGSRRSGFVLVRAVARLDGAGDPREGAGPGKAARMLGMDRSVHGLDLCAAHGDSGFYQDSVRLPRVVRSPRIGISRGQDLLWRFFLRDHPAVSGPRNARAKKQGADNN